MEKSNHMGRIFSHVFSLLLPSPSCYSTPPNPHPSSSPTPPCTGWVSFLLNHSTTLGAYPTNEDAAALADVRYGPFPSSKLGSPRLGAPQKPSLDPQEHTCVLDTILGQ